MFLHLKIDPEKCVPFQFLPVKSAQAAKFGGLLDFTATGNCTVRLRVPKPPPLTDCLGSQIVVIQISFVTECWDNIEPFSELLCCGYLHKLVLDSQLESIVARRISVLINRRLNPNQLFAIGS